MDDEKNLGPNAPGDISWSSRASKLPVKALAAIVVATLSAWLAMLLVAHFAGQRDRGGGFMRDTTTRLMGLIALAMGVQFALTGFHAFAP